MKKLTSDLISKNTVPRLANRLAKKMLINNRIVLLSLFRTSFLLLALLVGLLLLVMRETPADGYAWAKYAVAVVGYLVVAYFDIRRMKRRRELYMSILELRKSRLESNRFIL